MNLFFNQSSFIFFHEGDIYRIKRKDLPQPELFNNLMGNLVFLMAVLTEVKMESLLNSF